MRGTSRSLFLMGALLFAGLLFTASAQQEEGKSEPKPIDPKKTTRVTLGSTSGTPGASTVVPIYFTPAESVEVGRLKLSVNFVSRNLKFSRMDAGTAAEFGKVELRSEVQEWKNEQGLETATLTIVASFLTPEPPEKGIPAGLLGYVTFQIKEGAGPANISLRASAEAAELKTNKPVQDLRAFDAQVEVLAPGSEPLVSCFFFTH